MVGRKRGLLKWMMNNLTGVQKHLLTVFIMTIGLVILLWVVTRQMDARIKIVNAEIAGLTIKGRLRDFLQNVYIHKYLWLSHGEGQEAVKEQMLNLQKEATDDLRTFQHAYQELQTNLLPEQESVALLGDKVSPPDLDRLWKEVRQQMEQAGVHENLATSIYNLMNYVSAASSIHGDPSYIIHKLYQATSGSLPKIQVMIDMLSTLSVKPLEELTEEQRLEAAGMIAIIRSRLQEVESSVSLALNALNDRKEVVAPVFEAYSAFYQLAVGFLENAEAHFFSNGKKGAMDVLGTASRTINQSFIFWDEVSDAIYRFLEERKSSISQYKWLAIISSMLFILVAFSLGLYFVKEGLKQLKFLKQTALRIGEGDLAARVPIYYHDELGKVCLAFNRMALTVEQMVGQFHILRQATQRLASGDFSARVEVDERSEPEVKEVADAFNSMASSFESVVNRLHRLVIDLTSSATQIAASSRQQDAIISEQGATTKQISVTATEISATSKDFAKMIHEVGLVAEDTSRVAVKGQTNLEKMVKAMQNMEEAAFSIASRLKVLNEKASNITGISTTISEVSKQTHLLSLNAAIQAEKAGEAGRSFAVIAREIRTLADQTAMSTLDIEKIVTEIAEAIKSSVMGVDDFTLEIRRGVEQVQSVSNQLNQIISQVKTLVDRFERVDAGMKNQSEAAEQINTALIELTQMANETSISMAQFLTTIEHLDKAALDLRGTLEKIK